MNIPNRLTLLRIIMIPLFVAILMLPVIPYNNWIAMAVFIIASLTDLFDGMYARKHNLVTSFGKFMDPLADKLLVSAALICLVELGKIAAWIVILIIAREFIISGFRLVAATKGIVIAAGFWGKLKATVQVVMVCFLIADVSWVSVITALLVWASVILTVISLADYLIKNKDVMKNSSVE